MVRCILLCVIFFVHAASSLLAQEQKEWSQKFAAVDGKSYGLNDFRDKEVLVVVFTRNTCPIAIDYLGRLNKISSSFQEKQLEIISINVDEGPGESLDDMKKLAKKNDLTFRYIHDPKKILARKFNAKTTPHVFVLNKEREIIYQGLIDSHFDEDQVTESGRYLYLAVKAILAGEKGPENTSPKGCSIRY